METFILSLNVILAILLVIVIILQKSEGGALGIGVSQDSSSRSAGNFLTKATAVIATLFIVTSIFLTVLSRENMPTTSVLEIIDEKEDSTEPQIPKSE